MCARQFSNHHLGALKQVARSSLGLGRLPLDFLGQLMHPRRQCHGLLILGPSSKVARKQHVRWLQGAQRAARFVRRPGHDSPEPKAPEELGIGQCELVYVGSREARLVNLMMEAIR